MTIKGNSFANSTPGPWRVHHQEPEIVVIDEYNGKHQGAPSNDSYIPTASPVFPTAPLEPTAQATVISTHNASPTPTAPSVTPTPSWLTLAPSHGVDAAPVATQTSTPATRPSRKRKPAAVAGIVGGTIGLFTLGPIGAIVIGFGSAITTKAVTKGCKHMKRRGACRHQEL